jgi:hypothetical protein
MHVDSGSLMVEVEGLHKLWAVKNRLKIPLTHVRTVAVDPDTARNPVGLRLPGTWIPGVITAGSYRRAGEWAFWDVRNPDKTIVIELSDERYTRLVVEVADPDAAVAMVEQSLAA